MELKDYTVNYSPDKNLVKQFIKSGHYSHSCPSIKYAFTLELNNIIIGAIVFSKPSRQNISVAKAYNLVELSRLFIIDGTPKNTESFFIGKSLKWLKRNTDIEAIVSFADPTEGHTGVVYKATNFKLVGMTTKNYHYVNNEGKRVHKKQVWDRAKKNSTTELNQSAIENLTKVTELPKFKYVYYLKIPKNVFIIYGLIDPETSELRYVGKSENGHARYKEHLKPSSLKKNTHKDNWIKQLLSKNLKPEFIILEEFDNPDALFEAEEFWYNYYKGLGCNLTNLTECGKGTRGYSHTLESKEKIGLNTSFHRRGKPLPDGMKLAKEVVIIDNKEYRNCTTCKIDAPIEEFKLKIENRYSPYCRLCRNSYQREWRLENPTPLLSQEEYNKSRLPGAYAAGESSKTPERRKQASEMRSKAIIGTNIITGEVIEFASALKAKEAGYQNSNIGQAIKFNKPYRGYNWVFKTAV